MQQDPLEGYPDYQSYQRARERDWLHRRIRNVWQHNRHLSIREIAAHTGVSVAYVIDVLGLPASFPNNTAAGPRAMRHQAR